jgi:hypothetical protein
MLFKKIIIKAMFCAGFMVVLRIIIDGEYDTIDEDYRFKVNRSFLKEKGEAVAQLCSSLFRW